MAKEQNTNRSERKNQTTTLDIARFIAVLGRRLGNNPEAIPSKKKEALGISRVFHFKMDGTARIELAGFTPLTAHRVDNHHPENGNNSPSK